MPNHAFSTYSYNIAALEIFADVYCREILSLPDLDWESFWQDIKETPFFDGCGKREDKAMEAAV